MSIRHEEIERMIRQLASSRESSIVQAIGIAVRNELERKGQTPLTDGEVARRKAAICAVQDEIAKTAIDWSRTENDILGYDSSGAPEQPYLN